MLRKPANLAQRLLLILALVFQSFAGLPEARAEEQANEATLALANLADTPADKISPFYLTQYSEKIKKVDLDLDVAMSLMHLEDQVAEGTKTFGVMGFGFFQEGKAKEIVFNFLLTIRLAKQGHADLAQHFLNLAILKLHNLYQTKAGIGPSAAHANWPLALANFCTYLTSFIDAEIKSGSQIHYGNLIHFGQYLVDSHSELFEKIKQAVTASAGISQYSKSHWLVGGLVFYASPFSTLAFTVSDLLAPHSGLSIGAAFTLICAAIMAGVYFGTIAKAVFSNSFRNRFILPKFAAFIKDIGDASVMCTAILADQYGYNEFKNLVDSP